MILSMTGFGRSEGIFGEKKISVELKSLNSKTFDLNIRVPVRFKEKEFDIRKILSDRAVRGKVDCYINIETLNSSNDVKINKDLIRNYMNQLKECTSDGPEFEYLKMAVRLPEAISSKPEELDENEWSFLQEQILQALSRFDEFRTTEGKILHQDIQNSITNIGNYLSQVVPFEESRIQSIRERYNKALKEFDTIDETRYYQEISFFVEKLDISEEKIRLAQHLKYFSEVMEQENLNGKKLGFISQEIGREINTLGSKANHSEIQKLVVMMKDDLEKIKEQTLNVL